MVKNRLAPLTNFHSMPLQPKQTSYAYIYAATSEKNVSRPLSIVQLVVSIVNPQEHTLLEKSVDSATEDLPWKLMVHYVAHMPNGFPMLHVNN